MALSLKDWISSFENVLDYFTDKSKDYVNDDIEDSNISAVLESFDKIISQEIYDNEKCDRYWILLASLHGKRSMIKRLSKHQNEVQTLVSKDTKKILKEHFPQFGLSDDKNLIPTNIRSSFLHFLANHCYEELSPDVVYKLDSLPHVFDLGKKFETFYLEWSNQFPQLPVITFQDLIELPIDVKNLKQIIENVKCMEFDKTLMDKLYICIGQTMSLNLKTVKKAQESASHGLKTLKCAYPYLDKDKRQWPIVHLDWVTQAIDLSTYFVKVQKFNQARHIIACARKVFSDACNGIRYLDIFSKINESEVQYCFELLECFYYTSIQILNIPEQNEEYEKLIDGNDYVENIAKLEMELPKFPLKTFQDVIEVFNFAISRIELAKKEYTIDKYCSDYIRCTLNHADFYNVLRPFYKNRIDIKSKLNKNRFNLLKNAVKILNPESFLSHYRKLLYKLGDICSTQVSTKLFQFQNKTSAEYNKEREDTYKKINRYGKLGIEYICKYLSTYDFAKNQTIKTQNETEKAEKNENSDESSEFSKFLKVIKLPYRLDENLEIDKILSGILMIGILYNSLELPDNLHDERNNVLGMHQKYFEDLNAYLDRNPDHCKRYFKQHYELFKEMYDYVVVLEKKRFDLIKNTLGNN